MRIFTLQSQLFCSSLCHNFFSHRNGFSIFIPLQIVSLHRSSHATSLFRHQQTRCKHCIHFLIWPQVYHLIMRFLCKVFEISSLIRPTFLPHIVLNLPNPSELICSPTIYGRSSIVLHGIVPSFDCLLKLAL